MYKKKKGRKKKKIKKIQIKNALLYIIKIQIKIREIMLKKM